MRNSSKVGNTENCTGFRMYRAESSTTTPSVMLVARNKSSTMLGTGHEHHENQPTAATGTSQSAERFFARAGRGVVLVRHG